MRLQLSCFNSELLFLMVAVELVPRYYFFNLCKIQFCRECHLRGTWNLSAAGDYESLSMLCRKAHPCSDGTRLAPGWHQSAALQRDWQRWLVSHWKCASCLLRCLQVPYQKGFGGFHFFSVRHIFFFYYLSKYYMESDISGFSTNQIQFELTRPKSWGSSYFWSTFFTNPGKYQHQDKWPV